MSKQLEEKEHPGRGGFDDTHQFKRSHSLDIRLSPIELAALKNTWKESDFNSMAAFARYKIFGGEETKIDLYWDQKQEDKNLNRSILSELSRSGNTLNQIAKKLNSTKEFTTQEARLLLKDLANALKENDEIKKKFIGTIQNK